MMTREQRSPDAPLGLLPTTRDTNLLEWLFTLRDRQRARQRRGAWLIKGKEIPWEHNRNPLAYFLSAGDSTFRAYWSTKNAGWRGDLHHSGSRLHHARWCTA
jgi:hypothetical protein